MENKKTALHEVSRVEFIPMCQDEDLVLRHKVGESYTDIDFKFPFIHKKTYKEDVFIDRFGFMAGYTYTESVLKYEYGYIVKNGKVYKRPRVVIHFMDGESRTEHYKTEEEALNRYKDLIAMFGLDYEITE